MHDNKVRLSQDVLEKAERIAAEWGLKNARAAVEAVFRKYCDEYLYGRMASDGEGFTAMAHETKSGTYIKANPPSRRPQELEDPSTEPQCEALAALDQLLAL
jgi:hypothetical protein